MKKTWLIVIGVLLVIVLFFMWKYNGMVGKDQAVKTAWSQVQNVYQRRLDLIPNLVNTVKGAAAQESGVLVAVVNARANATKMDININDAQAMAQFQKSQWEVSSALSKLLAVVENYPTLQSIQAFRDLMTQLEGTENRITVERKNFNDAVNTYNVFIRVFPNNIIAGMFGFQMANLFEAATGAEIAPTVDFNAPAPAATTPVPTAQ